MLSDVYALVPGQSSGEIDDIGGETWERSLQLTILQVATVGAPRAGGRGCFGVKPSLAGNGRTAPDLEAKVSMRIGMGFRALLGFAEGLDVGRVGEHATIVHHYLAGERNHGVGSQVGRGKPRKGGRV